MPAASSVAPEVAYMSAKGGAPCGTLCSQIGILLRKNAAVYRHNLTSTLLISLLPAVMSTRKRERMEPGTLSPLSAHAPAA